MTARIYKPAKTAMQSGKGNTKSWVLEFESSAAQTADPLMGWAGSGDTQRQLKLRFASLEAAVEYAKREGIAYVVVPEAKRDLKIQTYADNFR
jgi:hypothetical protein